MHEYGLTQNIIDTVCQRASKEGLSAITKIKLEIGSLALIEEQSIRFYFDICRQHTLAQASTLEIHHIAARARCLACGHQTEYGSILAQCRCGSVRLDWQTGREMTIASMEGY